MPFLGLFEQTFELNVSTLHLIEAVDTMEIAALEPFVCTCKCMKIKQEPVEDYYVSSQCTETGHVFPAVGDFKVEPTALVSTAEECSTTSTAQGTVSSDNEEFDVKTAPFTAEAAVQNSLVTGESESNATANLPTTQETTVTWADEEFEVETTPSISKAATTTTAAAAAAAATTTLTVQNSPVTGESESNATPSSPTTQESVPSADEEFEVETTPSTSMAEEMAADVQDTPMTEQPQHSTMSSAPIAEGIVTPASEASDLEPSSILKDTTTTGDPPVTEETLSECSTTSSTVQGKAPDFNSAWSSGTLDHHQVAQSVEHWTCTQELMGSNPGRTTNQAPVNLINPFSPISRSNTNFSFQFIAN